jgi:hypothetical protein
MRGRRGDPAAEAPNPGQLRPGGEPDVVGWSESVLGRLPRPTKLLLSTSTTHSITRQR